MAQIQRQNDNGWRIGELEYPVDSSFGSSLFMGIASAWALWWVWRFVLSSQLFPLEIKEYPYWISGEKFPPLRQTLLDQVR